MSSSQKLEGMVFLSPQNMILEEAITPIFKEDHREARELRVSDFDDTIYKLVIPQEQESVVTLMMSFRDAETIKAHGGQALLDSAYAGMEIPPEQGYDVAVTVDAARVSDNQDEIIKNLTSLKLRLTGAPLQAQLEKLVGSGSLMGSAVENGEVVSIDYRQGETMYICPGDGRVMVVFRVDFQEPTDKAIARIFLHEFADAPRRVNNAPACQFLPDPPAELQSLNLPAGEDIVGYISFNIFANHVNTPENLERVLRTIVGFRGYLLYHIKASKTYLHMRMRSKVAGWMQVLNRAVMEEEKEKKTATGRTFRKK